MGYTYGFHAELAPDWIDMCTRVAGYVPRRQERPGPFRYLELGSGQGVGICLLAAANPNSEFVGVDFLPEHITHAEGLAEAAGLTNVRFIEGDFADLAVAWPKTLGKFDYVTLHGIYSWVSTELRQAINVCLLHATKPGSLIYNSYNSQPGWLGTMPFQHVAQALSQSTGQAGKTVMDRTVNLFENLRAGKSAIFQYLPALGARLDRVKKQNLQYLVQEYLHDNWHIHWHSAIAGELAGAKLNFLGSATLADNLIPTLFAPPIKAAIDQVQAAALKQDLQDIAVNQTFRRDIYSRGARPSFRREGEAFSKLRLVLVVPPAAQDETVVDTAVGQLTLTPNAVSQIIGALESGPRSIAELLELPALKEQGGEAALQLLLMLLHSHRIGVEALEPGVPEIAHRMNAVVAEGAAKGAPYDHIVSPVLANGIRVSNAELLLIDSWLASGGTADVPTLAAGLADRLARLGRKPKNEQRDLDGAEAQQRLNELAKQFLEKSLPRWRQLGALA